MFEMTLSQYKMNAVHKQCSLRARQDAVTEAMGFLKAALILNHITQERYVEESRIFIGILGDLS